MEKGPWLVICGATPGAGVFRIKEGIYVIGRTEGCDICLPHPSVSRRHAMLEYSDRHPATATHPVH